MTRLGAFQDRFLARIADPEAQTPPDPDRRFEQGLSVYRNNYRAALIEALGQTFERTQRWIGETPFHQAAAHYLILNPPTGWTLDDVGRGFDQTLQDLFPDDPEVGELAWLEWSMHRVFTAPDAIPLGAQDLAALTAPFTEADWDGLQLDFMPRLSTRVVHHDLADLWRRLGSEQVDGALERLSEPRSCHVVREGEEPVFFLAPGPEAALIEVLRSGGTFGQVCQVLSERLGDEQAALEVGAMLGRWLSMGLLHAVRRRETAA